MKVVQFGYRWRYVADPDEPNLEILIRVDVDDPQQLMGTRFELTKAYEELLDALVAPEKEV